MTDSAGATSSAAFAPLREGMMLGSYRLIRLLGQGGMGSVWEAEHSTLSKRVALKTLRVESQAVQQDVSRFLREGRATSTFSHPNAVEVFDAGEANGVPFIAMELLRGETLAQSMASRALTPSMKDVADTFVPIIAALYAAHRAGLVHRDVKPQNIFLARDDHEHTRPVLLDFGIAKIADQLAGDDLTHTANFLGTPFYVSPEQADNAKNADALSDQYSLAVVMYEILARKKPFEAPSLMRLLNMIAAGQYEPLSTTCPDLPNEVAEAIERAMHVDRGKRFSSLRDFAQAFLPYASTRVRLQHGIALGWQEQTTVSPSLSETLAARVITQRNADGDAAQRARLKTAAILFIVLLICASSVAWMFVHHSATTSSHAPAREQSYPDITTTHATHNVPVAPQTRIEHGATQADPPAGSASPRQLSEPSLPVTTPTSTATTTSTRQSSARTRPSRVAPAQASRAPATRNSERIIIIE